MQPRMKKLTIISIIITIVVVIGAVTLPSLGSPLDTILLTRYCLQNSGWFHHWCVSEQEEAEERGLGGSKFFGFFSGFSFFSFFSFSGCSCSSAHVWSRHATSSVVLGVCRVVLRMRSQEFLDTDTLFLSSPGLPIPRTVQFFPNVGQRSKM